MLTRCYPVAFLLCLGAVAPALAQTRRPASGSSRPAAGRPAAPPAPIEAARRVEADDDKPPLVFSKFRLQDPVLVFYQQGPPGKAAHQLLMDEKNLPLLKTTSLEELVARREVLLDGLGNYDPPATATKEPQKYRLTGVSALARTAKRRPAPDGRSTYARLKVPGSGDLYVVRESAEGYRHFVAGPQMNGSRIDFSANTLPGLDSVRAVYTLRKIDQRERGAGGEVIR